jgi:hypothetical protein
MGRRTTIISTITNGGGGGGAVVLGAAAVAVGILVVDKMYSAPGRSAFDKLVRKLSFGGSHVAGVDAPHLSKPFESYIEQVVQKAVTAEDATTLQQLAANLAAAGLGQLADTVRQAQAHK